MRFDNIMALVKNIIKNLKENDPKFEYLYLRDSQLCQEDFKVIFNALKTNRTVSCLCLNGQFVTQEILDYLNQTMDGENQTLKMLSFSYTKLNAKGTQYLANFIKKNQTITHLELRSCNLDNQAVEIIFKSLRNNKTLKILNLASNYINSQACSFIKEELEKNNTLEELWLSDNKIEDSGTRELIKAFLKNRRLVHLGMYGNGVISEETHDTAIKMLETNITLFTLHLPELEQKKVKNFESIVHLAKARSQKTFNLYNCLNHNRCINNALNLHYCLEKNDIRLPLELNTIIWKYSMALKYVHEWG